MGMVVNGLAAQLMPLSLPGHGAMTAREAGGGVGDPKHHGYLAHEDGSPCVRVVLQLTPHMDLIPTSIQVAPGKTLPSVKSKRPPKPTFGTIPATPFPPHVRREDVRDPRQGRGVQAYRPANRCIR